MTENLIPRDLLLNFPPDKNSLERFLDRHHLRLEEDVEYAVGLYDDEDELRGCGCAAGSLLKCFAVDEALRGQNALGTLVGALVQNRFARGLADLFVVTRAKNVALFTGCGFWLVAGTEEVALLENTPRGPEQFVRRLLGGEAPTASGAIVMNCNPFTLGHRALIEYAAARCERLHIFVVEEDRSIFPFEARLRLVQEGVAELPNVRVHPSGPYMISAATFPTYFLKQEESAAVLQTALDITLFATRIAPALGVNRRFAGEEPLDPVTRCYNDAMRELLPPNGIEFVEIPRVASRGEPISASRVRALLKEGRVEELSDLVPPTTLAYLKNEFKGIITR